MPQGDSVEARMGVLARDCGAWTSEVAMAMRGGLAGEDIYEIEKRLSVGP